MSTLADTLDAIDAALLPLAPGLILAPGNHGAQAAPSFPATALTAPVNTTDSAGSRRALLTAEEAVIAALYARDFARVHRLTFTGSRRAVAQGQGAQLLTVLTFTQRP